GRRKRRRVREIAEHGLCAQLHEGLVIGTGPHEDAYDFTTGGDPAGDQTAQLPGGACNGDRGFLLARGARAGRRGSAYARPQPRPDRSRREAPPATPLARSTPFGATRLDRYRARVERACGRRGASSGSSQEGDAIWVTT